MIHDHQMSSNNTTEIHLCGFPFCLLPASASDRSYPDFIPEVETLLNHLLAPLSRTVRVSVAGTKLQIQFDAHITERQACTFVEQQLSRLEIEDSILLTRAMTGSCPQCACKLIGCVCLEKGWYDAALRYLFAGNTQRMDSDYRQLLACAIIMAGGLDDTAMQLLDESVDGELPDVVMSDWALNNWAVQLLRTDEPEKSLKTLMLAGLATAGGQLPPNEQTTISTLIADNIAVAKSAVTSLSANGGIIPATYPVELKFIGGNPYLHCK